MNSPTTALAGDDVGLADDRRFFGHPRGLATLFFTEMWERFSYYGMRAFLLYYMTASVTAGGLGFSDADGTSIYGTYTGAAWGASIVGGFIADRFLGQYRSVLIGGIVIMLGHFTLVFRPVPFFYAGLALIVIGTGLLKPSASTLVGLLYEPGDKRRDAGYSLFYMGINGGAILGPIIAGYIAQEIDWHLGFGCAGVFMLFGVIQYVAGRKNFRTALERAAKATAPKTSHAGAAPAGSAGAISFSTSEWKRIAAIFAFFAFAILFWGGYEQAGSTLALFADRNTRLELFGFPFPSSWFQSVQPIFVVILAPIFAWLWIRLGRREPPVTAKFAMGLLFMGIAFLIMVPAGASAQGSGLRVSPWWLIAWNLFSEFGEVCLYPVGMNAVSKLSPARIVGVMMGVWFLSISFGNKLAGWAAGFITTVPLDRLFAIFAVILVVASLLMFALLRPIGRLTNE
ncbi:MAG TPA: peptide MFS transporter [Vicinamibacterales bacterium]|nr:peptide MFS transporter [Vicinamibacterales bacterium]